MNISKEEILHMAKLANLEIREEEINEYIKNLQDILNFANIVNKAPIDGIGTVVGVSNKYNAFRKDEVNVFDDTKALINNAPEQEDNMFKIPKVL